jgi:hypothetical protein
LRAARPLASVGSCKFCERQPITVATGGRARGKLSGVTNLSTALCSITPTQRRRYFWAAWWTGQTQPTAERTFEEALIEAETVAGRSLTIIDPYWARAWKTVLRGQIPSPPPASRERPQERARPARPVLAPLPHALCPMHPKTRAALEAWRDSAEHAIPARLLEHRERMHSEYMPLPMQC